MSFPTIVRMWLFLTVAVCAAIFLPALSQLLCVWQGTSNMADTDNQQWTSVCDSQSTAVTSCAAGHHWRVVQPRKQVAWIPLEVQNAFADCGGEIYSCRQEARDKLLLEGMNLWGMQVSMLPKKTHPTRPKQTKKRERNQLPDCGYEMWLSYREWIHNKIIKTMLTKLGCEIQPTVRKELVRNKDEKLSKWEMGQQFAFISKQLGVLCLVSPCSYIRVKHILLSYTDTVIVKNVDTLKLVYNVKF